MAHQGPPDWMQAFMAQQQQQMAAQQQQMQALQERQQAQVQGLQNALAQTNEAVLALQRPAPTQTEGTPESPPAPTPVPESTDTGIRRTKPILPNPPKFDGSRNEYEGWRSLIKDKIEVDGEVIGSNRYQFIYVASRLEGKGLQSALTFISVNRDTPGASASKILKYLDDVFGDRHKTQRAVESLRTMKQSSKEAFSAFLPRFEKALADAGGMAWPDEVKRSHLDGALAFELRRLAIVMPIAATYGDYVSELLRVSDLYRATMKHAPKGPSAGHRGDDDSMDWEPTRAAAAAPKGGQKKRARWVSQEEIDKRRQAGSCLRCSSPDHYVADCELLPARRPTWSRTDPNHSPGTRQARPTRSNPGAAPKKTTAAKAKVEEAEEEKEDEEYDSSVEELN